MRGGLGGDDAGAYQQHWAMRRIDQLGRALEILASDRRRAGGPARFRKRVDLDDIGLHVFWNIDDHRSRPAGSRNPESVGKNFEQLVNRADLEIMLRDR